MSPVTLHLRGMAKRVLEERAAFAVFRELYWDHHRVTSIWRPEDQTPPPRGRLVDYVFDFDGAPMALEVVRYGHDQLTIDAGHRINELERHLRSRLDERLGDASGSLMIELAYEVEPTKRLGRRAVEAAGTTLADACVRAVEAVDPGTEVTVDVAEPWVGSVTARYTPTDEFHRYFVHYPAGDARHLEPEVDRWIERVVRTKGTQHEGFAERAILAVIRTDIVDAADLARGLERFEGQLPWWRVYVLDLAVDRADLVRTQK